MRRLSKFSVGLAACALVLTACGSNADDDGDTAESEAPAGDGSSAPADTAKVALAYDVGGRGDQSFNDSAYAGLQKAEEEFGMETAEGEAAVDEDEATREDRLIGFAEDGFTAIVGVGFAYSESVNAVAPDYPEVNFAVIDGFDPDDEPNDNVAYLTFAENEGSFLVGAAAALQTETDHIGFVGGVNNALIQKFEAGYEAGAQAVNPDITIDATYIEQTDPAGFADPAGGKAAASAMYDDGADIVYHAAGGSGSGVFDAAVDADAMAIGVDSDQYLTASKTQQPTIITSMLKRVDVATYEFIKSVEDGEPQTSYTVFDLAADGVGYSTSGDLLAPDTITQLEDYKKQIIAGDIKVPEAP